MSFARSTNRAFTGTRRCKIPIETRISKIDSLYIDHIKKQGIRIDLYDDASDPFLCDLSDYREKCIRILDRIEFFGREHQEMADEYQQQHSS